ncbi:ABC transporter transmembrane domain-containing protein, partial [Salmonella enterica subsp. enterica serovar Cerro]|nr:ABC transporter transmembrane domain-containing protein [Salmonella enterica subsp. enterica serovar Cerro]
DANRRNFLALARLSGHFLDRLRGMETLRIFGRGEAETESIRAASQDFRQRTMEVLRLAFLSSGVLEFFTSLSIALVAVYFGFSYLGELNFGHYGTGVTLAAGFLALILAPEFFQPLRDLGTFYHAKAQAVGAADSLKTFLETPLAHPARGE